MPRLALIKSFVFNNQFLNSKKWNLNQMFAKLLKHLVEQLKNLECIYLTDLEQFLSAAKVPVQMQDKRVLTLSSCLWQSKLNGGSTVEECGVCTTQKSHLLNSWRACFTPKKNLKYKFTKEALGEKKNGPLSNLRHTELKDLDKYHCLWLDREEMATKQHCFYCLTLPSQVATSLYDSNP